MKRQDRDQILRVIRALLSKTVDNGCSEAEAMSAAAKVNELLDRISMTISDMELEEEICRQYEATDRCHEVIDVADSIAFFCDCKYWLKDKKIVYFGFESDVEIATYLTELCRTAMDVAFRAFLKSPERPYRKHERTLRMAYMIAMAERLARRIDILAVVRKSNLRPKGEDTVDRYAIALAKKRIVDRQFELLGINLKYRSGASKFSINQNAYMAGWAAGGRVSISPGVKSEKILALLGE
jgi:Protein of unknown function (DUF2786)